MSHHIPTTSVTCASVAPLLPLAKHNLMSANDSNTLRAHLATCAACRSELALYDQIEEAWQRAIAADQIVEPVFSQAELLALITGEPDTLPARHRDHAQPATPSFLPAAPRKQAHRLVASVSAIAACLLIVGIIGAAFLARERGSSGATGQATATPAAQNISRSGLSDISMVSANEGWAIGDTYTYQFISGSIPDTPSVSSTSSSTSATSTPGDVSPTPSILETGDTVLLWHYLNGTWSPVQLGLEGKLTSISMDSPTDGWAVGTSGYSLRQDPLLLLHYDGHTWQEVSSQGINLDVPYQVQMLSPTDGWLVGTPLPSDPTDAATFPKASGIWHYDGQTWTEQPTPLSQEKTQTNLTSSEIEVSSISMISASEGWAVATGTLAVATPPSTTPVALPSPAGAILHYTGGHWEVQQFFTNARFSTVSMLSATDGWIGGQHVTDTTGADPTGTSSSTTQETTSPLLLHYTQGQWVDATTNANNAAQPIDSILSIFMQSATEGWLTFLSKDPADAPPELLHYNGTDWSIVRLPSIPNTRSYAFARVFTTSATEGWAVGSREVTSSSDYTELSVPILYHFHQGVWSIVQS